jgi:eukaryotic-like serine/threonine-protein kinase
MAPGKEVSLSKPAAYTEEQVRHWLWFLARNMQSHGQSMFMLEQLEPSWLLTKWQIFVYLLLSRTVMFGALAMLTWSGIGIIHFPGSNSGDKVSIIVGGCFLVGFVIGAIGLIVGLLCALVLFLRTSDRLPGWTRLSARLLSWPLEFILRLVIVWPLQWTLQRIGRTLEDDIQPVEQISWSWMNFLKGLAFLTIKPPKRNFIPLLNRSLFFLIWAGRILWFALLAVFLIAAIFDHDGRAQDISFIFLLAVPNFFCAFFSAIRGNTLDLKTAPNLGILLSGRNALITISINVVLALGIKLALSRIPREISGQVLISTAIILAGTVAWGRLGGLDYLAHYCLRFVLRRCGYIPRDYVRFLNYAATELGFLQKVGGGYVFMHRYLLEYFASSERSSSAAMDFSAEGQPISN